MSFNNNNNNNNNSIDDDQVIREETPVLQSVAIMQRTSPSESPLQFSLSQQQQQCSPFSSLSPLARNTSMGLKKATQSSTQQTPSVITTPDETSPFVWRIDESHIQQLPEDYPLERTHLQVDAKEVNTIAERISHCLRNHSIDAKYNKATVKAQTSDRVKFYIRFYKSTSSPDKLIVEVQRRCGCSFLFHNTCRSVFRAIRGNSSSPASIMMNKRPRSFTVPESVKQMAAANATTFNANSTDGQQKDQNQYQPEEKDIKTAASMLKEDRLDSNLMGLETLVSWTQPSCEQRAKIAHDILTSQDLLQTVLNLVHKWKISCNSYEPFVMEDTVSAQATSEDDEEDDHEDPSIGSIEQEYLACMHRQALTLMSNCFDVISSEGNTADFKIPDELLLGGDDQDEDIGLLSILIQDIANAANRPCDACEAAKCIKGLFDATAYCSCHLMDITMAMGLREAIADARQQGHCQHYNLEQETTQVQKQLL